MSPTTSSDPLAAPWLPLVRWASAGLIAVALVVMTISLTLVVSQPAERAAPTQTLFGQEAPAQRSRLETDGLAWVPVAAFGVAMLALTTRLMADRRAFRIKQLRAQLGVFPPPQPGRWDRWLARRADRSHEPD